MTDDNDIPTNKWDQLQYSISNLFESYGNTDSLMTGSVINGGSAAIGLLVWHFVGGLVGIVAFAWALISLFALIEGVIHA